MYKITERNHHYIAGTLKEFHLQKENKELEGKKEAIVDLLLQNPRFQELQRLYQENKEHVYGSNEVCLASGDESLSFLLGLDDKLYYATMLGDRCTEKLRIRISETGLPENNYGIVFSDDTAPLFQETARLIKEVHSRETAIDEAVESMHDTDELRRKFPEAAAAVLEMLDNIGEREYIGKDTRKRAELKDLQKVRNLLTGPAGSSPEPIVNRKIDYSFIDNIIERIADRIVPKTEYENAFQSVCEALAAGCSKKLCNARRIRELYPEYTVGSRELVFTARIYGLETETDISKDYSLELPFEYAVFDCDDIFGYSKLHYYGTRRNNIDEISYTDYVSLDLPENISALIKDGLDAAIRRELITHQLRGLHRAKTVSGLVKLIPEARDIIEEKLTSAY